MDPVSSTCSSCCRVMASRLLNLCVIALLLFCSTQAAMKINLKQLMSPPRRLTYEHKRGHVMHRPDDDNSENSVGGNPCVDYPDHPFPCKNTIQCLPFNYICDKNFDCTDESDEDPEMCTASRRPPIDELKVFLEKEKDWLIPQVFPGKTIQQIAQALAVSPTVYDLQDYLHLSDDDLDSVKYILTLIKENRDDEFLGLGMPAGDWPEVNYILKELLKTGFDGYDY